jgi:hypothetical protein
MDVSGKLWYRSELRNGHNELNIQNLNQGLYLLHVKSEEEFKTDIFKLIVE